MSASLSVSVHQWLRQRLATTAPLLPLLVFKYSHPPPPSLLLLIPLYISQSGLKIDENLLWDYVLRAANNVEEPPGLSLPKQRSNKTRNWEIHGYLIETEASELFTGSLSALVFFFCILRLSALPAHPSATLEETWYLLFLAPYSLPRHCHKHALLVEAIMQEPVRVQSL